MFKFTDLQFEAHPLVVGVQATYKGWSVIKCVGSSGFLMGQYEVQDPKGGIHGYLSEEAVELLIRFTEADVFSDDEMPF